MIDTNGRDHQAVAEASPVVLVRHRPGVIGEATRTVHVVPLPLDGQHDTAAIALCGTKFQTSEMEIVTPGYGMPCTRCLLSQFAANPPPPTPEPSPHPDTGHRDATADYERWGWPVTGYRDQVRLRLAPITVALIIPALQAAQVTEILTARRCQPAVLTHLHTPDYQVLLAGEPYPVTLPWPLGVNRITTQLLLPPTPTPHGPLRWVHPPHENSLQHCREIDVLAAVRTTLRQSPGEMRGDLDG
ncbi:MAG: hypothetical protein ACRDS0_26780 [Pseudonocardiaceae bacterium]